MGILIGGPAHAAGPTAVTTAPAASVGVVQPSEMMADIMTSENGTWLDMMIAWMREIVTLLGGDPDSVDAQDPAKAMADFRHQYDQVGIPGSLTSAQKSVLLGDIDALDAVLLNAPGTVSAGDIGATRSALADMKHKLLTNPAAGHPL